MNGDNHFDDTEVNEPGTCNGSTNDEPVDPNFDIEDDTPWKGYVLFSVIAFLLGVCSFLFFKARDLHQDLVERREAVREEPDEVVALQDKPVDLQDVLDTVLASTITVQNRLVVPEVEKDGFKNVELIFRNDYNPQRNGCSEGDSSFALVGREPTTSVWYSLEACCSFDSSGASCRLISALPEP